MKRLDRISQLTLDLYRQSLAALNRTRKKQLFSTKGKISPGAAHALTKNFYIRHARAYAKRWSNVNSNMTYYYSAFARHLPPGATVIDAGCGHARDVEALIEQYKLDAWGIDSSLPMIAEGFKRNEPLLGNRLIQRDIRCLSASQTPALPVAGIWCNSVLHHFPGKEAPALISQFKTCLAPGGVLFLLVRKGRGEDLIDSAGFGQKRFYKLYTAPELRQLLWKAGLVSIDVGVKIFGGSPRIYALARKP